MEEESAYMNTRKKGALLPRGVEKKKKFLSTRGGVGKAL